MGRKIMAKRFFDTNKYKKRFIRSLSSKYKIFWDYIICNCDNAGIWHVDFDVAKLETGEPEINEKEALEVLSKKIVVFDNGEKWFIPSFVYFQYGDIDQKISCKPVMSVIKVLTEYSLLQSFRAYLKNKQYPNSIQTVKDKDMDIDKDMYGTDPTNLYMHRVDESPFVNFEVFLKEANEDPEIKRMNADLKYYHNYWVTSCKASKKTSYNWFQEIKRYMFSKQFDGNFKKNKPEEDKNWK